MKFLCTKFLSVQIFAPVHAQDTEMMPLPALDQSAELRVLASWGLCDHWSVQLQGNISGLLSSLLCDPAEILCRLSLYLDSLEGSWLLWFVFVGTQAPLAQSEESGCWSGGSGLVKGQVWPSGCVPGRRFLHSGRKAWFILGTTGYLI